MANGTNERRNAVPAAEVGGIGDYGIGFRNDYSGISGEREPGRPTS